MDAERIADLLEEIAVLLELEGENTFKVRAYENGARAIRALGDRLPAAVEGGLVHIEGVGATLREKVLELWSTGRCETLEKLRQRFPPGVHQMLKIPGIGPKKVRVLLDQLHVSTVEDLERACHEDRLAGLKGFGKKTQDNVLAGLAHLKAARDAFPIGEALPLAEELLGMLRGVNGVQRAEMAGSLRRRRESVHDADLLAAVAAFPEVRRRVAGALTGHSLVKQVLADGDTKVSVRLQNGLQVDLRMVEPHEYAAALLYFTGSKLHNVKLRGIARDLGYTLNEYSVGRLDAEGKETGERIPAHEEAEIYAWLGFLWIPPAEREDRGEFERYRMAMPQLPPKG